MQAPTSIRLRPHHLFCILTFVGAGYSRAFIKNLSAIVERIGAGTPIVLVSGPDDICSALLAEDSTAHCGLRPANASDAAARATFATIAELRSFVEDGSNAVLDAPLITNLRERFADGSLRAACGGCEWFNLCTDVANSGFAGTAL